MTQTFNSYAERNYVLTVVPIIGRSPPTAAQRLMYAVHWPGEYHYRVAPNWVEATPRLAWQPYPLGTRDRSPEPDNAPVCGDYQSKALVCFGVLYDAYIASQVAP